MSLTAFPTLLKKLKNKSYRDAYVAAQTRHSIAYQIKAIREQRDWSQSDLGERANKPQNVISRLESPNYGKVNIQSLLTLAAAFDVALIVRFVKFDQFVRCTDNNSPQALEVPNFDNELAGEENWARSTIGTIQSLIAPRLLEQATTTESISESIGSPPFSWKQHIQEPQNQLQRGSASRAASSRHFASPSTLVSLQ